MNVLPNQVFNPSSRASQTLPARLASAAAMAMFATAFAFPLASASAQDPCLTWRTYPQTFYRTVMETETRLVNETEYETTAITKYRPTWTTEKRERKTTVLKPVTKTRMRVETQKVYKPVTETMYRDETVQQRTYEEETRYEEEEYTVRKPVLETEYREEEVTVRRPVTETRLETERYLVYRPKQVTDTELVPTDLVVPNAYAGAPIGRPRLQWLPPGYYTDPASGKSVFRRRGLHWVTDRVPAAAVVPTLTPQSRTSVAMVPETVEREKPVEVTRYETEYRTRKVPVEVERMVEETRTRKVPVTVRVPKTKTITRKVPYTETRYKEEIIERRVPIEETSWERVEKVEPYDVSTCRYMPYTENMKTPKTVTRRVEYTVPKKVPYIVMMRVAVDAYGNQVGEPEQVAGSQRVDPDWSATSSVTEATTRRPVDSQSVADSKPSLTSVMETDTEPAQFDVPDSRRDARPAPIADSAPAIRYEDVEKTETANKSVMEGESASAISAPDRIEFEPVRTKFTVEPRTDLATVERPERETVETSARAESEIDRFLRERQEQNLINAGLRPVGRATVETSGRTSPRKTEVTASKPPAADQVPRLATENVDLPAVTTPQLSESPATAAPMTAADRMLEKLDREVRLKRSL